MLTKIVGTTLCSTNFILSKSPTTGLPSKSVSYGKSCSMPSEKTVISSSVGSVSVCSVDEAVSSTFGFEANNGAGLSSG